MNDRLLSRFLHLCAVPGSSGRERPMADAVGSELGALGLQAREDGAAARKGGTFDLAVHPMFQPFRLAEEHPLVDSLRSSALACGLDFLARRSGGGSDANALSALGLPAVNLAVGYYQNHSDEECLVLRDFEGAYRLAIRFLRDLDARG